MWNLWNTLQQAISVILTHAYNTVFFLAMMKPEWNPSWNPTSNSGSLNNNASQATNNNLSQRSRSFSFSGIARLATGLHKYTVTSVAELDAELTTPTTADNSSLRNRSNSDSERKSRSTRRLQLPKFRRPEGSMMPIKVKLGREKDCYGCTLPSSEPALEGSMCLNDTLSFTVSRS